MFALMDPKVWGVVALIALACFSAGYLTKAHYAAIEVAKAEAAQKTLIQTVEKVVTISDTRRVQVLTAKLKESEAKLTALQTMIAEEANEKPAAVECRVSDGVRDAINGELSTAAR